MARCVVEKVDQCVVIRLVSENKENRLNPEFIRDFNKALDEAERYIVPLALSTVLLHLFHVFLAQL